MVIVLEALAAGHSMSGDEAQGSLLYAFAASPTRISHAPAVGKNFVAGGTEGDL
jgi:hypothetical protein